VGSRSIHIRSLLNIIKERGAERQGGSKKRDFPEGGYSNKPSGVVHEQEHRGARRRAIPDIRVHKCGQRTAQSGRPGYHREKPRNAVDSRAAGKGRTANPKKLGETVSKKGGI